MNTCPATWEANSTTSTDCSGTWSTSPNGRACGNGSPTTGSETRCHPCPSNDAGRNSSKPGHGRAPPTRSTRTSPWSKHPGSPTCSKSTDTARRGPSRPCSWMTANPESTCSGKIGTRDNPRATTCSMWFSTTAGQAMTRDRPTAPCACCTRPFRPIPRPSTTRSSPRSSTPAASNEVRHATR